MAKNQLRINGEKELTDQRLVEKVLRSLPKKFEMVVTALLESKDLTNFFYRRIDWFIVIS